ncbi:MAG TPA: glutathione S-transferase family protein [Tahibacter sp.]|uniref:glutathione S-transferase family protein n=1 Tax=Tahibacter sp. TaxID=2056211 RepID=UPI002BF6ABE6|nr:glutathione S-transferase family protein [Tahibacter sp.]HSX60090.1 glutathione S-transferase family protein [Tahibacter sp.]
MNAPLKLYSFAPFDRAARVRWTAHELGVPVEEVGLNYIAGEHREAAYRAKNPFCRVPLVETDQGAMVQSVAICQYLAEQHPESGLVPPLDSPLRASWLSWLFVGASDLDAAGFQVLNYTVLRPDPEKRATAIRVAEPLLQVIEAHMADRDYVVGDRFTLPDIVLGHELVLLSFCRALDGWPHLIRYRDRLSQRPAAQASGLFGVLKHEPPAVKASAG